MSADRGPFDAKARKESITEGWDALAERWDSWAPTVESWFAPATKALLEMTRVKPGNRVLELAAGSGGLTLTLAGAVGPDGRVVATDVGPNMVKLTARNARIAGVSNVVARVMDGETPDLSWASMDTILCRQGFMFFPDPTTALGRLSPILRPGGFLGLTVFSTPERNRLMAATLSILARYARPPGAAPPPSGGPGPFSLGAPGMLESMVRAAGFVEIESREIDSPMPQATLDELLRFYRDMFGNLVQSLPAGVQDQAWKDVAEAIGPYPDTRTSGGSCEILVVTGRRPALQSNSP